MAEPMSFVKACQDFFTRDPLGRKIEVPEFKELTREDKEQLREMLIEQGYNVLPLGEFTSE